MAKQSALEKAMIEEIDRGTRTATEAAKVTNSDATAFNITRGQPLPDGFENPRLGEEGHRCLDRGLRYNPDWSQLRINKVHEHQRDPQTFSLAGVNYAVPLDEWVDAPPEIIESLRSAVETYHEEQEPENMIKLGLHPIKKTIERKRFWWDTIRSA